MRMIGYCETCHRFRQVQVSGHALAMAAAHRGNVVHGTCDACEQKEQDQRLLTDAQRRFPGDLVAMSDWLHRQPRSAGAIALLRNGRR